MGELSGNLRNVDRPNARAVRVAATPPLLDREQARLAVLLARRSVHDVDQSALRVNVLCALELTDAQAVGLELLQGLLQLNVLRQRSPREWRERMSGVEVDREDIGRVSALGYGDEERALANRPWARRRRARRRRR